MDKVKNTGDFVSYLRTRLAVHFAKEFELFPSFFHENLISICLIRTQLNVSSFLRIRREKQRKRLVSCLGEIVRNIKSVALINYVNTKFHEAEL
jgi:hypothetical protein